ncbi:MAG: hypothetical protein ACI84C_000527 [Flavobacteriales bacterium]|jgi:hypothetical protein
MSCNRYNQTDQKPITFGRKLVNLKIMLELAKIILPAFIVMLLALFFFDRLTSVKKDQINAEQSISRLKVILPLKISAIERLVVMMERLRPSSMVMRLNQGAMTAGQLHLELSKGLRHEFEHNVSLQMYVTDRSWQVLISAKEETLQLYQVAASQCKPADSALRLCEEIFQLENQVGNSGIELALKVLKAEIRAEF